MEAQAIKEYTDKLAALEKKLEDVKEATNNNTTTQFEIYVSKDTFKFNASHFVAYPGFRERLHGHNYRASVKLIGNHEIGRDGYVLDFGCVKTATKDVCKKMNEYFIVPMLSEVLTITVDDDDVEEEEEEKKDDDNDDSSKKICGDCNNDDNDVIKQKSTKKQKRSKYPGSVHIVCEDGSAFLFPRQDCLLLPIMHSTAEEFAIYLFGKILEKLDGEYLHKRGVKAMEVTVSEAIGQDATFRRALPKPSEKSPFDVASYISKQSLPVMPCATDTEAAKQRT